MALNEKQVHDLNNMNVAAQEAKLGDIVKGIESGESVANATTEKAGVVKQCTAVPEASGANVTKEEFKALLDALKTAGIMASS